MVADANTWPNPKPHVAAAFVPAHIMCVFPVQEDVLRSECPLLTDDERALFASLKVLLSETSGSSLEQAPLLRAINKAIDRIDSQVMLLQIMPTQSNA